MYYSLIGILALLTLVITNHDVILKAKTSVTLTQKSYRFFLLSVITYYVTDIMWGIFEALSMTELLFIDTEVYFMAMALGTFLWTRYVTAFLNRTNDFRRFLRFSINFSWMVKS